VAFHRDPIVCVDETEIEDYRAVIPRTRLLAHPSEVNTLQRIRRWILDQVDADIVFQMDDDIKRVECMVGPQTRKLTAPEDIEAIIWNAALNCRQGGTIFFFFAQVSNPITFQRWKPFKFITPP
jgi:TET-Associated Glycosyltransferase